MPSGTLAPPIARTFLDGDGNPLAFAKLYSYAAGTLTDEPIYQDHLLATPHLQPAVLDADGRLTFFCSATSYRFILKDVNDVQITDEDGITAYQGAGASSGIDVSGTAGEDLAVNEAVYLSDGSGGTVAGRWYRTDADDTAKSTLPSLVGFATAAITTGTAGLIRIIGSLDGFVGLTPGPYFVSGAVGAITAVAPANNRSVGFAPSGTTLVIELSPRFVDRLPPSTSTITTVGAQIALALPVGDGPLTIHANNPTLLTIQGIAAGKDGQQLTIFSIGAGQVDLAHQNGAAAVGNRLINCATSGNTSLAAGSGVAVLQYDATATRWRLRQHEQGAWITPAFVAGTYTGVGGGTWTLAAGDVTTQAYRLVGRTVHVMWVLVTTTVAGVVGDLSIGNAAWGGFTAAKAENGVHSYSDNGGAEVIGSVRVAAAGAALLLDRIAGANWTAAVDTTSSKGQMCVEVQ